MSKSLNIGAKALVIFLYVIFGCVCIALLAPLSFLYDGLNHNIAAEIINDRSYLILLHHNHISANAISHFPSVLFSTLMALGLVVAVIATLIVIWSGIKIIKNVTHGHFFTSNNVKYVNRIVLGQALSMVASSFLAAANHILRSNLYRINSDFPTDWSDVLADFVYLIIFSLVAFIYKKAVLLHEENKLTI